MALIDDMFSDAASPAEKAQRLDSFKSAISGSVKAAERGETRFDRESRTLVKSGGQPNRNTVEVLDEIIKSGSLSGESLEKASAARADLVKEWTPTNPVGMPTGYPYPGRGFTGYDLVPAAIQLVPYYTPLRNSTPRKGGRGTAHQFKRLISFTNAGVPGGAAAQSPFFSSSATTNGIPGSGGASSGISLLRPNPISYTGDSQAVGFVELGFSDYVSYLSEFQSLGFEDERQLSKAALLWSHLMGEERAMLYARGSSSLGYTGAVAAPAGTATAAAPASGTPTIPTGTYNVWVSVNTGFGQSTLTEIGTGLSVTLGTDAIVVDLTAATSGNANYNLYVGTGAVTAATLQATFTGSSFTLLSYSTTGVSPTTASDTSADANAYDGFMTVLTDPSVSGYYKNLDSQFSGSLIELDEALYTMYVNNGADPDELHIDAATRQTLNSILRDGSQNGYRVNLVAGDHGTTLSTIASGYMNPNTSKVLSLHTHRFMPAGNMFIRSTSLNTPNNHVGSPAVAVNVQDYMAIDWADIQMTYDTSTYQIGTLAHYAPSFSGWITGIQPGIAPTQS